LSLGVRPETALPVDTHSGRRQTGAPSPAARCLLSDADHRYRCRRDVSSHAGPQSLIPVGGVTKTVGRIRHVSCSRRRCEGVRFRETSVNTGYRPVHPRGTLISQPRLPPLVGRTDTVGYTDVKIFDTPSIEIRHVTMADSTRLVALPSTDTYRGWRNERSRSRLDPSDIRLCVARLPSAERDPPAVRLTYPLYGRQPTSGSAVAFRSPELKHLWLTVP
jgi:hypothetical protein